MRPLVVLVLQREEARQPLREKQDNNSVSPADGRLLPLNTLKRLANRPLTSSELVSILSFKEKQHLLWSINAHRAFPMLPNNCHFAQFTRCLNLFEGTRDCQEFI